jgi:hypothetical protein
MNYYKKINKTFKKLMESKVNSFNSSNKLKEDNNTELLQPINWYQELLERILENIKGDWFDAYLVGNVIYVIESDFDINIGGGETQNIGLGIFAIYEFKSNRVTSYLTKPETIEDTDKIGKKPLSYFIEPDGSDEYDNIAEFIDWYDYYYGRKTFMLDPEFGEYFNSIKIELETLKESDNNMLNARVNFITKGTKYVLTKEFKNDIIDNLSNNTDFDGHFYGNNPLFNSSKVDKLMSELDKEWSIKYGKLDDREEYLLNKNNGYSFDYIIYIADVPIDYVTSEFVYSIMGVPFNEAKESDVDLEPLDVSLIKRGDDYVATPGFKGYLVSILDDETPGSLDEFRKISKYFLNMDSYIDEDIDFYADNMSKEWVFKLSKDTSKEETDFTYGLWIGNQWIDWVNDEFFKPFVKKEGLKEDADNMLAALSIEDVKRQIENEEIGYDDLGDTLFTDYAEILPDGLYELIDITGDNINQLTPTSLAYLKNKLLNEFDKFVKDKGGNITYRMESDDLDFDSGDISSRFLKAAFDEEMMFQYFDYSSSDVSLTYLDSYLDEDNLKELERLGITKELLKDIIDENISEDEYEYVDLVESELRYAAAQAYNSGAEKEAQKAFNEAFKNAMPSGVTYTKDIDNKGHFANITITESFVSYYHKEIIEKWQEYDNMYNVCVSLFLEIFRDDFNMREPRYGFQGFDEDEFNGVFSDTSIPEIEARIEEDKKEQK